MKENIILIEVKPIRTTDRFVVVCVLLFITAAKFDMDNINFGKLANRLHIASKNGILIAKGVIIMARTSNVFARVEPEIKEEAEMILDSLGIPMSNAVSMFLRQVILQRGIPFEVKLPKAPFDISKMSKEEIDIELEKGYRDIAAGRTVPAEDAFKQLHEKYGI